ncbi:MAG: hypothetical protein HOK54_05955 [Alphaproteobacteria bacterium]|nr:hypothetical protein [Alphaproteobacteria bacterium]
MRQNNRYLIEKRTAKTNGPKYRDDLNTTSITGYRASSLDRVSVVETVTSCPEKIGEKSMIVVISSTERQLYSCYQINAEGAVAPGWSRTLALNIGFGG